MHGTCARDVVHFFCYISVFFPQDILAAAQCPILTKTQASNQSQILNTENEEPVYTYDNVTTHSSGQTDMDIH